MSKTKKQHKSKLHELLSDDLFRVKSKIDAVKNIFFDCHSDSKTAYDRRCLDALVHDISASDLLDAILEAIPDGYNGFNIQKIERILEVLLGELPDDPTSADIQIHKILRDYKLSFGRESSPVLYIRFKERIWIEKLKELEQASGADEFSIEDNGVIRIWWD